MAEHRSMSLGSLLCRYMRSKGGLYITYIRPLIIQCTYICYLEQGYWKAAQIITPFAEVVHLIIGKWTLLRSSSAQSFYSIVQHGRLLAKIYKRIIDSSSPWKSACQVPRQSDSRVLHCDRWLGHGLVSNKESCPSGAGIVDSTICWRRRLPLRSSHLQRHV